MQNEQERRYIMQKNYDRSNNFFFDALGRYFIMNVLGTLKKVTLGRTWESPKKTTSLKYQFDINTLIERERY